MNHIIADVGVFETRAAVLEGDRVEELHFERNKHKSKVNNVYCGKIVNIVQGMGTIFVDIGIDKNVFLHESDLNKPLKHLSEGDSLLVQITKDALGSKGAKATAFLSFPGKYVVLLSEEKHIGISNRVVDERERERLQNLAHELIEDTSYGIIMRTEAVHQSDEIIETDFRYLQKQWEQVESEKRWAEKGDVLFREEDLLTRLLRDVMNHNTESFLINDAKETERVRGLCEVLMPEYLPRIRHSEPKENLFEKYEIEAQWKNAMKSKIVLKSGGSLVINATEALTVIDVNSGKFTGSSSFENTIFQINMEAVQEIARQLRLRDIGGIIVIDFIDMKNAGNKEKLLRELNLAFSKDRQKTVVLGITKVGLVEVTRKKTREKVDSLFNEACSVCHGTGRVPSVYRHIYELENQFRRLEKQPDIHALAISVHPDRWIELEKEGLSIQTMAEAYGLEATIIKDESRLNNDFQVKIYGKS